MDIHINVWYRDWDHSGPYLSPEADDIADPTSIRFLQVAQALVPSDRIPEDIFEAVYWSLQWDMPDMAYPELEFHFRDNVLPRSMSAGDIVQVGDSIWARVEMAGWTRLRKGLGPHENICPDIKEGRSCGCT